MSKRNSGFTLIELLIVTVVIVTLMGIVFRLAGVGGSERAKAETLKRMQRIENALSGYYAAYGSYPPVPLQGRSRSIHVKVGSCGVQGDPKSNQRTANLTSPQNEDIKQVEAACRAQPIAVLYPFFGARNVNSDLASRDDTLVEAVNRHNQNSKSGSKSMSFRPLTNVGNLVGKWKEGTDWHSSQVFQFGLLSFLLPRYLFMLQGDEDLYELPKVGAKRVGQWAVNNQLPSRLDNEGKPYERWAGRNSIQEALYKRGGGSLSSNASMISNLASQAVCARWMPNFEGIISGGLVFYGIDTDYSDHQYLEGSIYTGFPESYHIMHVASEDGNYDSSSSLYLLDGMTIMDGWGIEFYYYSPPPYQSYRLWSAGPNKRTFPPWYDLDSLQAGERKTVAEWTDDDLSHLEK